MIQPLFHSRNKLKVKMTKCEKGAHFFFIVQLFYFRLRIHQRFSRGRLEVIWYQTAVPLIWITSSFAFNIPQSHKVKSYCLFNLTSQWAPCLIGSEQENAASALARLEDYPPFIKQQKPIGMRSWLLLFNVPIDWVLACGACEWGS